MNWTIQDLGSIGEFVGSFAVLFTLLYLSYQLRQTTLVERAAGQRDLLKQCRQWWELSLVHPDLFDQIRRGLDDWYALSAEEQDRVNAWAFSFLHILEEATYMHEDGFINDVSFHGFLGAGVAIAATPGGRVWWSTARQIIGDDVSDLVDRELEIRPESAPGWNETFPHLRALGAP